MTPANIPELGLKTLTREWLRAWGPDALRFLNGMWTCDFKRGQSGAGFLLSAKVKAIAPGVFWREGPDSILFSLPAGSGQKVLEALDHYLVADEVELALLTDAPFAQVCVVPVSPFAPAGRELLVPSPTPGAKDENFAVVEEAWGLRVPRAQLGPQHEEFWIKPGAALPFAARELSDDEYAALRIEAGVFEWGQDLPADTLPLEFPVAPYISFHKGCYIGQEVVARATYRGHMVRGFARFSAEPGQLLRAEYVFDAAEPERPVGKLTTVRGHHALGLLRLSAQEASLFQLAADGSRVAVQSVQFL